MTNVLGWSLFALGVAHVAYGFTKFRAPVVEATAAGFVGQFQRPEVRRTAFWFLIFGPLTMLAGHAAVHAAAAGDAALLRLIGIYMFVTSAIGVAALPKSPFWVALVLAPLLIAASYGRFS